MCSFHSHGGGVVAGHIRRILNRSAPFAPCAARGTGHGLWFSHPASSSRRLLGRGDTYRLSALDGASQDQHRWSRRSSFVAVAAHIVIRFRRYWRARLCQRFSFNIHQQFLLSCVVDLALRAFRHLVRERIFLVFFIVCTPFCS